MIIYAIIKTTKEKWKEEKEEMKMRYKIQGRLYEVVTFEQLSERLQKEGPVGTVKIRGIKYLVYDSGLYNSVGYLVASK